MQTPPLQPRCVPITNGQSALTEILTEIRGMDFGEEPKNMYETVIQYAMLIRLTQHPDLPVAEGLREDLASRPVGNGDSLTGLYNALLDAIR